MIIDDYVLFINHNQTPEHPHSTSRFGRASRVITTVQVYDKAEWEAHDKSMKTLAEKGTPAATGEAKCCFADNFCRRTGVLIAAGRAFKTLGKRIDWKKDGGWKITDRKHKQTTGAV